VIILNPAESVLQTKGHRSVTIYFQDGGDYLQQTHIETLLANLNALPGMPALTGVFIPPIERMKEYAMNDGYATFLTYTVVKNVEALFPFTGGEAQKRLVIGASMGGLISVYIATKAPQIFGLVASQSGSLWFDDKAVLKFIRPGLNLKMFIENGVFESPRMLEGNRAAVQLAQKAGIPTHYEEYPTTHDWYSWRNRLSQIFRSFFDSSSRRR
jgi:enterochelin esterase family protein